MQIEKLKGENIYTLIIRNKSTQQWSGINTPLRRVRWIFLYCSEKNQASVMTAALDFQTQMTQCCDSVTASECKLNMQEIYLDAQRSVYLRGKSKWWGQLTRSLFTQSWREGQPNRVNILFSVWPEWKALSGSLPLLLSSKPAFSWTTYREMIHLIWMYIQLWGREISTLWYNNVAKNFFVFVSPL